jgi:hypothetical protein
MRISFAVLPPPRSARVQATAVALAVPEVSGANTGNTARANQDV